MKHVFLQLYASVEEQTDVYYDGEAWRLNVPRGFEEIGTLGGVELTSGCLQKDGALLYTYKLEATLKCELPETLRSKLGHMHFVLRSGDEVFTLFRPYPPHPVVRLSEEHGELGKGAALRLTADLTTRTPLVACDVAWRNRI